MERLDNIGFGDLKLIQDKEEFCYGIDAVLLADFAAAEMHRTACGKRLVCTDLGAGTGIVPIILSHKLPEAVKIAGIEVQEASFTRFCRNIGLNGLDDRLIAIKGDVGDPDTAERARREIGTSDIVTCNPPYVEGGRGQTGHGGARYIARTETTGTLDDFIRTAAVLLADRGDFYMVHRPSRLADIICTMRKYRIEPKNLRFVSPKTGEMPNILLIHGVLGGGPEMKIEPALAVYGDDGKYSQEILAIYERG